MNIDEMKLKILSCNNENAITAAYNALNDFLDIKDNENNKLQKTTTIEPGLTLYSQQNSPFFWIRYHDKENNIINQRSSSGEKNLDKAKQKAFVFKAKVIEQAKSGRLRNSKQKKWQTICEEKIQEYDDEIRRQKALGKKKPTSLNYKTHVSTKLLTSPSLFNLDIDKIDYAALYDLSKEEKFDSLGKSTITMIKTALSDVFEMSLRKKYITAVPKLPKFDFVDGEGSEPFTIKDREQILSQSNMITFYENSTNFETKHIRSQFPLYVLFVELSGLRPGEEVLNVKWSDIKKRAIMQNGKRQNMFFVEIRRGKMQKNIKNNKNEVTTTSREMLLYSDASVKLEDIYFLNHGVRKSINAIADECRDEYLFNTTKLTRPDFGKTFSQYISMLKSKISRHYSIYSLRHEFINRKLDEGMSKEDIASQCGNSVETISRYYEDYRASRRASRLYSESDFEYFNKNIIDLAKP